MSLESFISRERIRGTVSTLHGAEVCGAVIVIFRISEKDVGDLWEICGDKIMLTKPASLVSGTSASCSFVD